jgi:copper resistance protein C
VPTTTRARALITLVLAFLGLSLATAAPASAHDRLLSSNPADGATVGAPENVTLTYSAEILPTGARVQVKAPDASVATSGDPTVKGTKVVQQVDASAPGTYSVTWRVTSSDGHPISGTFSFTVKEGAAAPTSTSSAGAPASSGAWANTGGKDSGSTSDATLPPTTRIGTDETSNRPLLVGGLAVATLLVVAGGAMYARGRLRDDE